MLECFQILQRVTLLECFQIVQRVTMPDSLETLQVSMHWTPSEGDEASGLKHASVSRTEPEVRCRVNGTTVHGSDAGLHIC